jgi:hypothetical protein
MMKCVDWEYSKQEYVVLCSSSHDPQLYYVALNAACHVYGVSVSANPSTCGRAGSVR